MPLEIVLKYLHKPELFRLSWGAGNAHGEEWATLEAEFEARLARMTREALRDGSLHPQAVYGFFPAASDGDDLVIYDPLTPPPDPLPEHREGENTSAAASPLHVWGGARGEVGPRSPASPSRASPTAITCASAITSRRSPRACAM